MFYPNNQICADFFDPPLPASKTNIPDEYRKLKKYRDGKNSFFNYGGSQNNLTVKSCMPVIDAYTSGYTISLPYDIQVHRLNDGSTQITWAMVIDGLPSFVNQRQGENEKLCTWNNIEGYDQLEFNWLPYWSIKTPKGYSSMFIHPINRVDLPFYTIGGVLDTDGWGVAGNHPFLIKKGWSGIIEAGTPVMQIIPFKRDDWNSFADKTMINEYRKQIINKDKKIKDYYKINHWKTKQYR